MIQDKESGLILPDHVFEQAAKAEETWTYDTIRKLRYAAKELEERDVEMVMTCRKCHQPLQMEVQQGVVEQRTGRLVCKCKVRRVI